MRSSDALALALVVASCADPLYSSPAAPGSPAPPALGGCLLFQQDSPDIALPNGAGISLPVGSSVLWMFNGATLSTGTSAPGGSLATVSGADATHCFPATAIQSTPAFAPLPQGAGDFLSPLDMIAIGSAVWSYYQVFRYDSTAVFGIKSVGFGIAPFDQASGQFVPGASVMWAGDAQSFGASALDVEGSVYVYGCGTAGAATSPSCYLAQAPEASIDDVTTYQYAVGSNRFSPTLSDALPLIDNAGDISVRLHSTGEFLLTYVQPLDSNITIQSALTPTGPFSQPYTLGACQLESGDFCAGARQHPENDPNPNTIAVSYVAASFNSMPPGDRYWPRLAFAALPANLP